MLHTSDVVHTPSCCDVSIARFMNGLHPVAESANTRQLGTFYNSKAQLLTRLSRVAPKSGYTSLSCGDFAHCLPP